jgi:hypothetical protein
LSDALEAGKQAYQDEKKRTDTGSLGEGRSTSSTKGRELSEGNDKNI